jgi:hypothetical protein
MIELKKDVLEFSFPEVHESARLRIELQRTLRIPDDDKSYPLPPGLGPFPLRHVDDFPGGVPRAWIEHGGVMLPMYQSEAMWLSFSPEHVPDRGTNYPFAIKVATGKINAATGEAWSNGLSRNPQDYLVAPLQPWLDGYCVEKGFIRQFVAMPLGQGFTAEEQVTGKVEHGGLQIVVYPMKRKVFEQRFPVVMRRRMAPGMAPPAPCCAPMEDLDAEMGLAPGGKMRQEIYEDPYGIHDWDDQQSRCFIHLANSLVWRSITGENPPTRPPTAKEYTDAGLPWFDYYAEDATALKGAPVLDKMKSVAQLSKEKRSPLADNDPVDPDRIVELRSGLKKGQVREGKF